jgi:hypothetical protein
MSFEYFSVLSYIVIIKVLISTFIFLVNFAQFKNFGPHLHFIHRVLIIILAEVVATRQLLFLHLGGVQVQLGISFVLENTLHFLHF